METTRSREIYANPWMVLREDTFRRPDGGEGLYGVVDKPHYALVIAVQGDEMMLVEQFRYPIGLRRWEFPQGSAPGHEESDPIELANRELREETGLRAASMELLGTLDVAPGMSSQRGRVFLATGITEGEHDREHEAGQRRERVAHLAVADRQPASRTTMPTAARGSWSRKNRGPARGGFKRSS